MDNKQQIAENIVVRQQAEALIALVACSLDMFRSDRERQRFLGEVHAWVWERLRKKPEPERKPIVPMSEAEAVAFENLRMPFGQYDNKPIRDVPLDYLAWLSDQPDHEINLMPNIKRYLKSDRVKSLWRVYEEYHETDGT